MIQWMEPVGSWVFEYLRMIQRMEPVGSWVLEYSRMIQRVEPVGSWVLEDSRTIQRVEACLELASRSLAYSEDTVLIEVLDTVGR